MNDVVLQKKARIERCIGQIRMYYADENRPPLKDDFMRQDAIAQNVQRACEQCIDLANHTVRQQKLGLPSESRESFRLLAEARVIPRDLAQTMERMVGLRNLMVHAYQQLDFDRLIDVVENRLDDLLRFVDCIVNASDDL